jgi:hypothetical protein
MSWTAAGLLLIGCAAVGALLGTAPARVRTALLVVVGIVVATILFLPGTCATAIASAPSPDPDQVHSWTSCTTFYGATLPAAGALDGDVTGRLLALAGALAAGISAVLVRRRHR